MLKCDNSEVQLSRKVPHGCCWSEPYASCGVFKIQTRIEKSESLISRLVKPVRQLISVITILVTQIYKNCTRSNVMPVECTEMAICLDGEMAGSGIAITLWSDEICL